MNSLFRIAIMCLVLSFTSNLKAETCCGGSILTTQEDAKAFALLKTFVEWVMPNAKVIAVEGNSYRNHSLSFVVTLDGKVPISYDGEKAVFLDGRDPNLPWEVRQQELLQVLELSTCEQSTGAAYFAQAVYATQSTCHLDTPELDEDGYVLEMWQGQGNTCPNDECLGCNGHYTSTCFPRETILVCCPQNYYSRMIPVEDDKGEDFFACIKRSGAPSKVF